jgi:hypothetical protein
MFLHCTIQLHSQSAKATMSRTTATANEFLRMEFRLFLARLSKMTLTIRQRIDSF